MSVVTFSTDLDDDGTGLTGTPYNNAWKQAMAAAINASFTEWAAIPYSAGNFTASTGSWTVEAADVLLNMTCRTLNKTLKWAFYMQFSSVSSTPARLLIALPSGTFDAGVIGVMTSRLHLCADNNTNREGLVRPFDSTHLEIVRADGSNWTASTNLTSIGFQAEFLLNTV